MPEPTNIADAITAAQGRVADAYTAISNKGGTLPATQNLANMPTAIGSITTLNGTTLSVTPTTSAQSLTPSSPYNGYTSVSVSAVTSSIDSNISAGNIKSGVTILGVSGTVTQLVGETRSVSITSTSGNTFTPTSGKNGITSITVTPTNQAKTITPTTSQQSISVPSGYSGFGTLTVSAVTSSIDANIIAGNIKSGVSILGVSGSYTGPSKFGLTLDNFIGNIDGLGRLGNGTSINGITFTGVIDFTGNGLRGAFAYNTNLTGAISFPDLVGVTYYNAWSPLSDAFRNTGITSFSCPNLETISRPCSSACSNCTSLAQIDLSKLKTISGSYICNAMFYEDTSLTSVSLPLLETIDGTGTCQGMFSGCSKISSISMSSLKTISGFGYSCSGMFNGCGTDSSVSELTVDLSGLETISGANCSSMFYGCTKLVTLSFTSLNSISGFECSGMFGNCNNLTTLYFPALTTTSFGSTVKQFNNMFNGSTASSSGTCTVHFPSNLQTVVSGLTGYPTFGGNSSRIVLAFDLTATS